MKSVHRLAVVIAVLMLAGPSARAQHARLFPPQDLGQLEGPDREVWQRPEQIMDALEVADGSAVADLGAGGGWFTVRLARRVGPNGVVWAEDVQPEMIESIKRRVQREQLRNVHAQLGTSLDPRLPERALDAVLMVETYHEFEQPVTLLRNIARALKPRGRLGIVEFSKEGFGPGPAMENRVDPERVIRDARAAGFDLIARPTFLRYQYMLVFGHAGPGAP